LRALDISIADGYIDGVREVDLPDAGGVWLAPGFIDLQVNGYAGFDVNADDLSEETIIGLTAKLLAAGTTAFLPTIITAPERKILHAVKTIARARHSCFDHAHAIPGIHLEGPHIAPEDGARGAHAAEHVRPPNIHEFDRLQQAAEGLIRLITLSPHWPDAPAYIHELTKRGVIVSLGHTSATLQQIRDAVDAGATLSTHLGNGIPAMLPRHPNPIWSQLADDRLRATFIADGHHLSAEVLKVMLRAKTIDRSLLVSDSVALAGMPPGVYETPVGGRVEMHPGARLNIVGTEMLAGAALPLKDNIGWLLRQKLCSLADAVHMASLNPATLLDMPQPYAEGSPARLVRFHVDEMSGPLTILDTVCGESAWHAVCGVSPWHKENA
jgi:N-acetylglucosamine-6-phosphate deacetylase